MRAVLTAVIAAIEAAAVALAGLAVVAVPAVLVWWLAFDLGAEPGEMIATIAGGWLLGHLVPLTLTLSPETALGFGLAPEALTFTLSLAPLGVTCLTALLAFRAGRRFAARGGAGAAGVLGGLLGFGAAAFGVAVLGAPFSARPLWFAALVPALCYGASTGAGYLLRAAQLEHGWWRRSVRWVQRRLEPVGPIWAAALPARAAESLRLAAGGVAGLVGLGALGFAVAIVVGYVDIVALSQSLQLDLLGLLVLFLLSVVLLPVACLWAAAWFTGAGFAVGGGTSVTPFETLLGPLPAFPLLGAVPQGWGWAGGLAPALVVLLGVVIGALAGQRTELRRGSLAASIVVPLVAAALAGLAVAGLMALATGAVGPERLSITGPDPWRVGALAAAELGLGLVPGVLARRLDAARLREALPSLGSAPADAASVAEQETVPQPRIVRVAETSPVPEKVADPAAAPDPGAAPPEAAEPAATSEETPEAAELAATSEETPEAAPEHDDPLLRAFAWENGASSDEDPDSAADSGAGWRPPWRRR